MIQINIFYWIISFLFIITVLVSFNSTKTTVDVRRLYSRISEEADKSKLWRPVDNDRNRLIVYVAVTVIQIMNVDEKSNTITISIWLRLLWKNNYLRWNPDDYGGIKSIYLPPDGMWVPDIVLVNTANGKYETQFPNTPTLYYNGLVDWKSPAIFLSSCDFDMTFFPYDEQTCFLEFGSQSYKRSELKLKHVLELHAQLEEAKKKSKKNKKMINSTEDMKLDNGVYFNDYQQNGEWDLLGSPTMLSTDYRNTIKFGVRMRRKIMFYNINLIGPMVSMSTLAALSFYLPADSDEKITLSTLILLSITVFFVLLAEQVPATSLVSPIINQYLIISFLMTCISLAVTVLILNFNSRSALTDKLIKMKYKNILFWGPIPKMMLLEEYPKPMNFEDNDVLVNNIQNILENPNDKDNENCEVTFKEGAVKSKESKGAKFKRLLMRMKKNKRKREIETDSLSNNKRTEYARIKDQIKELSEIICEISRQTNADSNDGEIVDEWKYTANVIDRMMFITFSFLCILVGLVTYFQSPTLFDKTLPLNTTFFNDSRFNKLFLEIVE